MPVQVVTATAPGEPRFDGEVGDDHERDNQADMGRPETHDEMMDRLHL